MEKPKFNVEDITRGLTHILAVSSEGDDDTTYVHRIYTSENTDSSIVQAFKMGNPDAWLSVVYYDKSTSRNMIILPNEYLTAFTKLQEHDVLIYLFHQFACVKDYNMEIDTQTDGEVDYDDYRELSLAYQKTLLHFGTERVLEYIESNHDPVFEIPLRVLKIKAETSKYYEGNPDSMVVDILIGTDIRNLRMELLL